MARLQVLIKGLREGLDQAARTLAEAKVDAVRAASGDTKKNARATTAAMTNRRLGNTWRDFIQPSDPKKSGEPSAIVFSAAPNIIVGLATGATVMPRRGRFLAIPTRFNRRDGRGRLPVTPEALVRSRASFVRPRKNGPGLIWFARVFQASDIRRGKRGGRARASIAGIRVSRLGRVPQLRQALGSGAVPVFTLVPSIKLPRKIPFDRLVAQAGQALERRYSEALQRRVGL